MHPIRFVLQQDLYHPESTVSRKRHSGKYMVWGTMKVCGTMEARGICNGGTTGTPSDGLLIKMNLC